MKTEIVHIVKLTFQDTEEQEFSFRSRRNAEIFRDRARKRHDIVAVDLLPPRNVH